ncbi:hypothetical protein LSH36_910g01032 [Paralvinella palmiformis]|uniref:Neuropeptide F n=1 Tax=Paralvinella palmiformis TaxID=53620 RepID=A0AAD9MSS6_9ANNE|nr:hypothetical protein LSH36_910g01032 [Paralvinella palmiformis]
MSLHVIISLSITLILLSSLWASEAMNGPPARPKVFKNPEELRQYLKDLNEYFAIVGRPRTLFNDLINISEPRLIVGWINILIH